MVRDFNIPYHGHRLVYADSVTPLYIVCTSFVAIKRCITNAEIAFLGIHSFFIMFVSEIEIQGFTLFIDSTIKVILERIQ
jgi:hypothetical protein